MFDVLQISWWLIEATLLGLLCNRKFFDNNLDRLLFAPITGFACVLIVGNLLWMQSVSTHLMSYLFVGTLLVAALHLAKDWPRQSMVAPLWLVGGAMLVTLQGSLIPLEEKLFQAFPLDRYFYQGSSILFAKENISYFQDALERIAFNGDKRAWFIHPLMPMAVNEIIARPDVEIGYVLFSWATPHDLYRLANAWEVFFRVLQFSGLLALFWKGLGPKFLSGFLALATVFGYWFQYTKDFNAWSSSACLTLTISIIAYVILILNNGKVEPRNRYFTYFLTATAIITYPELGIPFALGLFVLVCSNKILRKGILLRNWIYLEVVGIIAFIFAIHPHILAHIQRQSGLAPAMIGGEATMARGIYRLLADREQLNVFVASIVSKPIRLLYDPVALADMITGSAGLAYVTYVRSSITLIVALGITGALFWTWITTSRPQLSAKPNFKLWMGLGLTAFYITAYLLIRNNVKDFDFGGPISLFIGALILSMVILAAIKTTMPNLRILLVLVAFYQVFFVALLIINMVGGSYRTPPYWGAFGSITLLILLAASEIKTLQRFAVLFACVHLAFGVAIFKVTNKKGMESFASFYPNATSFRHTEITTIRDKYDFDYTDIIPALKLCHSVFLDLPQNVNKEARYPRFHAVNLMMFLENNDIRYYLAMPYRNASPLIGGEFHPGFKREEVNADCVVEEEVRNGRISYKFIQAKWY